MSKRNAVVFSKPEEPAFIRKMKEQAGFKEGPTIDSKVLASHSDLCMRFNSLILVGTSKREQAEIDIEDREELDEERPTVVVLKDGDLTAEEAVELQQDIGEVSKMLIV